MVMRVELRSETVPDKKIEFFLNNEKTWNGTMFDWDFSKFNPGKVKNSQNLREFDQWISWIRSQFLINEPTSKPFSYLEIGSYAGESLYYLSQIFPKGSNITLVDLGDNHDARAILTKTIKFIEIEYEHKINLLNGYSDSQQILSQVKAFAPHGRYDMCFIDANHDFKWAFKDYMNYRDKADWIAFHDISDFNIEKTTIKYGYEIANAVHIWKVIKSLIPQEDDNQGEDSSGPYPPILKWVEFIDYDNNTDMNIMDLKPRGIAILRSQW